VKPGNLRKGNDVDLNEAIENYKAKQGGAFQFIQKQVADLVADAFMEGAAYGSDRMVRAAKGDEGADNVQAE